jgi:predicted transcriptional regulator
MEMLGRAIASGQSELFGQFSENQSITSSNVRAVKLLVGSESRWKKPLSLRHLRETVDNAHPVSFEKEAASAIRIVRSSLSIKTV